MSRFRYAALCEAEGRAPTALAAALLLAVVGFHPAPVFASKLVAQLPAPNNSPAPPLIYMTRTGLDVAGNEIDKIISTFGYICIRLPSLTKPCRIESELLSFLGRIPPNRRA